MNTFTDEENLIIKTSSDVDYIFELFRKIPHTENNCYYISRAMRNPYMADSIDHIVELFIKNSHMALYIFIDGFMDNINNYYPFLMMKVTSTIMNILRKEHIYTYFRQNKMHSYYIDILDKYFQINYDAEISLMG